VNKQQPFAIYRLRKQTVYNLLDFPQNLQIPLIGCHLVLESEGNLLEVLTTIPLVVLVPSKDFAYHIKDGASFWLLRICTAHLGSGLRYSGLDFAYYTVIQRYFCAVYDYEERAGLNKGYQNPKRKLG